MAYMKEEIKAGVIVLSALTLLTASVILLSGRDFTNEFDTYKINVINTSGLEPGAHVRLGGVKIGKVSSVIPPETPDSNVTIVFKVKKDTRIFKGTKVMIAQQGFIGEIYLLLTIDNLSKELHKDGDTLPSGIPVQFNMVLLKLIEISERINAVMEKIDKLVTDNSIENINLLFDNLNMTLETGTANINKITGALLETTEGVSEVLGDLDDLIKDNKEEITSLIAKTNEAAESATAAIVAIEDAAKASRETIESIEDTSAAIDTTSDTLKTVIELHSANLDVLFEEMILSTEQLNEVLVELKTNPWRIIYREGEGVE